MLVVCFDTWNLPKQYLNIKFLSYSKHLTVFIKTTGWLMLGEKITALCENQGNSLITHNHQDNNNQQKIYTKNNQSLKWPLVYSLHSGLFTLV
jgi:hypothetical protein